MKKPIIFVLLFCPFLLFGQNTVDQLVKLFAQKKYAETLQLAKVKRNSARASELAAIDLIIACSYCLTSSTPDRGKALLDKITNNYRLSRKQERSVQQIRAACGRPGTAANLPELDVVKAVRDMGEVAVRGGSAKTIPELSLVGVDRFLSLDDEESTRAPLVPTHDRSFTLAEKEAAVSYFADLYPGAPVPPLLTKHFLINSLSPINGRELSALGDRLDHLLEAYAQGYNFERPDGLIVIHIAPDATSVNRLSRALYGIEMGGDNRGYSDISNRSMLVKITEPAIYQGTLLHELMHILVNYNMTLPPWLSEGLPALYEATTPNGYYGVGNWRYDILTEAIQFGDQYLSPELFEMSWSQFDAQERTEENGIRVDRLQQAVNQASARYFVLFLQDKLPLRDLVAAFANYHYGHPSFDAYETNTQVIEAVTGQSMEELWEEYITWLKTS